MTDPVDAVPVKRKRGRPPGSTKPKDAAKQRYATPERLAAGLSIAPLDNVDAEVIAAVQEGRPVDPAVAFPDPPPSIAQMQRRGAVDPLAESEPALLSEVQPGAQVLSRNRNRAFPVAEPQASPPPLPESNDSPGDRLRKVGSHATAYLQEFRLKLLHRMLMRNLPLDMIAAKLELSVGSVNQLRSELTRRLVYEAQTLNRYEIAGRTMAFYDEIQGSALRMADDNTAKPYVKLQALQTALGAQADRQRFLSASGFWAAAPYVPMDATEDASSRAATKLHTLIEAIIDDKGEMQIDELATDEHEAQSLLDDSMKLL